MVKLTPQCTRSRKREKGGRRRRRKQSLVVKQWLKISMDHVQLAPTAGEVIGHI